MKELMAIYDPDIRYGERLKNAINGDEGYPYYAMQASDPEELNRLIQEERIEILLISGKEEIPDGVPSVFRMTEVPGYAVGEAAFCKYQSVGKIKQEILRKMRVLPEGGGSADHPDGKVTYIGIASPVGRALKTSFGLVLGQLLSQNARTLYVNLEPCPGAETLFGREFASDLSDVLFAGSKEDWDGTGEFTEELHGLKLFPAASVPEDIYETAPTFLASVIRKYAAANDYEAVVLDLGTEYRIMEEFLPNLHKLYIPTRKEPIQEAKVRGFLEWITRIAGKDLSEKAEIITLPMPGIFARGKYDPEQLLFSELGDTVRSMLGGMY